MCLACPVHCPCQERSVEGIHSRISRTLVGRPLQVAGLAMELKWPAVERLLQTSHKDPLGVSEWFAFAPIVQLLLFTADLCLFAQTYAALLDCPGIPAAA